eukprot:scaffold20426_cov146-Isochrysis_galbana.AAC.2
MASDERVRASMQSTSNQLSVLHPSPIWTLLLLLFFSTAQRSVRRPRWRRRQTSRRPRRAMSRARTNSARARALVASHGAQPPGIRRDVRPCAGVHLVQEHLDGVIVHSGRLAPLTLSTQCCCPCGLL